MNTQSFERQLQQIDPPAPDPEARLRARHAAVEEFERLNQQPGRKTTHRGWQMPKLWLGGFATACLAIVGVSLYWLTPEKDRAIAPTVTLPVASQPTEQSVASQTPAPEAIPDSPPSAAATEAAISAAIPAAATPTSATTLAKVSEPAQATTEASRTLTLTDGRRVTSTSNQADVVDLNIIPSNLLERMDVVTGGAGAGNGSGGAPGAARQAGSSQSNENMELSELQVSGTRIQSPNVTSANPVTSITAEEMQRLGIVNVGDALTTLVPQNISAYQPTLTGAAPPAPPAPPPGVDRSAFFIGNTVADLRGLDPTFGTRTLTLIDGRRVNSTVNPADGDKFSAFAVNPVKRTVDEPESTFSIDVDTSSYSYVRRQLNAGVLPSPSAVRTEEMINYFNYDWPAADSVSQPFKPKVMVSDSPWGAGKKLVHIGIKGYDLPASQRPDVNLVLLLDVSGSMNSPDKLPLAQSSMALLLDSLKPTDTVGIAVYAGAAGEVLPPTPVSQKETILRALYSLRPGGSTAGAAGVRLAYEMASRSFRQEGVNRIVLATDGDFNVGINDVNELKRFVEQQRQRGIFLSVLGFGQGNYRDDIAQVLAQNGNGVAAYIDTANEARKVLVEQAGSQLFTIARDVKIQVEFNPATVAEYRLVGYETRALNREDFNNDKVDAGDVGAGHTVTAIYEITPVDSPARLFEERRYGPRDAAPAPRGNADEYGFLKIRYKLPDQQQSRLIQEPITVKTSVPRALRQDVAFSTAVAGFAQLLQGGEFVGPLSYDDVFRQAQGAQGEDPHGYRAEFLQLVRRAQGIVGR
jgi:Ca-activated chloride channel family protein